MESFFRDAAEFLPILMQGLRLTILVTIGSLVLSTLLGLVWALMRVSGVRVLETVAKGAVNLIRGIPIIVQLFYIYFVMPDFGVTLTALQASIMAARDRLLGLPVRELPGRHRGDRPRPDRGGAVDRHGLVVLPPYGNIMIMMLKDSSQASTITVAELALQGKLIASSTFQNTAVFTLVAALYLCMSLPLIWIVSRLEARVGRR